ncbi:MAG: sulfotransferase [Pseudomonadota bacterium]
MTDNANIDTNNPDGIDEKIQTAKLLLQRGLMADSMRTLDAVLQQQPQHLEALYYLAVCQRKSKDSDAALGTLQKLQKYHPAYGRGFQEQGHIFRARQLTEDATRSYKQAVALNPALLASWNALAEYYRTSQDTQAAEHANQHVAWLSSLPPPLVTVTSLIAENKLFVAEKICRQFLQSNRHHVEAMRLLAEIGTKLMILDDAEFLLESCVEFKPDYQRARLDYVQVLHKRQKFALALAQAEKLYAMDPKNISFEVTLANEHQAVGDFPKALEIYERVLTRQPNLHPVHAAKAHALKTIGHTEDAIDSYRQAYAAKPDYGDAYWSLANLKTYQFSEAELDQMQIIEQDPKVANTDRVHLCFALGKAMEDQGDFAEAFTYYERGNTLKKRESQYTPERVEQELEFQRQHFGADFFAKRRDMGCSDAAPIFIVGLPRAGSTLLEQILASHSQVDGTMELANIISLAHQLNGRRVLSKEGNYPGILKDLDSDKLLQLGQKYMDDTRFHRGSGDFFIDKMPNNFRHIPLIQLILPNAKIIDARRHPMACCFSGYKQLFAEGQEFTYGLDDIGRYYRAYVDIMDHWDTVLPGRVLRVHHEAVIADLETQVRRILDYCDLPFEPACLEFYRTERAVKTPSSEQVRQPIYTSGLEQWRNFEVFLNPLREALGSTYDYPQFDLP